LLMVLIGFQFWLRIISARLDTVALISTIHIALSVCIASIAACIAALGAHLLLRGRLIVQGRRFPPRDVRAVRDTPVREGDAAVRVGRMSQLLGGASCVVALLVIGGGWYWISRF
jgi:hypothetical protein